MHSKKAPSLLPTPAQLKEVLHAAASLARPGNHLDRRGVRDVLLLLGQLRHLRVILFVCGGDMQGQQVAQGIDDHMPFAPRWLLAPSEPARGPLSGLDCRVRLRPEDRARDARAPPLRGLKKDSSG